MIFWHLISVRLGIMTGSVKPLWSTIRSGFSVWISLNLALIISGAVVVGFLPVIAKGWLLYSSFFGCTLVFDTEMQNQFGLIVKRNICWMKQRERERERDGETCQLQLRYLNAYCQMLHIFKKKKNGDNALILRDIDYLFSL